MAWSSYAHLPNSEDEYWSILSQIRSGMSINEVDTIIASVKGKEIVQHHYRSNLSNLGLFDITSGKVYLKYDVKRLIEKKFFLKEILADCINRTDKYEIITVKTLVLEVKTYDIAVIAEYLKDMFPDVDKRNFIRWMRPITNLLKIIDVLSLKTNNDSFYKSVKSFQDAYIKYSKEYGGSVSLENIDKELKKEDNNSDVLSVLGHILDCIDLKFRIELLMLPNWATHSKSYIINKDYYSHIKIKSNLLEGMK